MSARRADQLAAITAELRADDWWPRETYLCGCCPDHLCEAHAKQRGDDDCTCGHPADWHHSRVYGCQTPGCSCAFTHEQDVAPCALCKGSAR